MHCKFVILRSIDFNKQEIAYRIEIYQSDYSQENKPETESEPRNEANNQSPKQASLAYLHAQPN